MRERERERERERDKWPIVLVRESNIWAGSMHDLR